MAPGSRVQKNAAEELHRLRDELKKKEARIVKLEREKEAALAAHNKKKLIPRPKGQAGRSSGYNLKEKMGLEEDGDRYDRLYRIVKDHVHQYLAVGKTISGQDKNRLESTLALLAKTAPFFARFEGFWPAHDMIAGYLLNAQTRRRRDLLLEKQAEAGNSDSAAEDDGRAASDGTVEHDEDCVSSDGDEHETTVPRSKRQVLFRIDSDDDSEDDSGSSESNPNFQAPKRAKVNKKESAKRKAKDDPVHKPSPKKSKVNKAEKESAKRKAKDDPVDEPSPKKSKVDKAKPDQSHADCDSPEPKSRSKKLSQRPLAWSNLPATCPTVLCEEKLPEEENQKILGLFQQRLKLVQEVGRVGPGVSFLELQICAAITQEKKRDQYAALGRQNDWPDTIDYTNVRNRILEFRSSLLRMIKSPSVLKESSDWTNFLNRIKYQIFEFSAASSIEKMNAYRTLYAQRCGYYGSKGEFLINSTIIRLLSSNTESLANKLSETVHALVADEPEDFDDYDETSNLIELKDFISFVLTPFVAALLIADDRGITLEEARDVRDNSNAFGDLMQPGDDDPDDEIDLLHRENIRAVKGTTNEFFSQPPRFRNKASNLPLAPPKTEPDVKQIKTKNNPATRSNLKPAPASTKSKATISIADFKEPRKKEKKAPTKKETRPKAEAKPNPVKSNYGTRSKSQPA
ncbi:hypothetical protein B0H19DRAFT_1244590 [Mycena capillaripes]|nr:hypothetical protein B0H19DRAFT_1244590 [Mycena capillaripes]